MEISFIINNQQNTLLFPSLTVHLLSTSNRRKKKEEEMVKKKWEEQPSRKRKLRKTQVRRTTSERKKKRNYSGLRFSTTCSGWPATQSKRPSTALSPEDSVSVPGEEVLPKKTTATRNRAVERKRGQKQAKIVTKLGARKIIATNMREIMKVKMIWYLQCMIFSWISMAEVVVDFAEEEREKGEIDVEVITDYSLR